MTQESFLDSPFLDSFGVPHLVALVFAFTVVEGACLYGYDRLTGGGVSPLAFVFNWLSGLCLLVAVFLAASGSGLAAVAPCLMAAGALHAVDLRRQWRRRRF